MWLSLERGARHTVEVVDRQSIWPAPDGSDAELLITTDAALIQDVVLATPRVIRLAYRIERLRTTMTLGEQAPAPWPEASEITDRTFELMLTERGPLVVPGQGGRLPNRLACWLDGVAENVRSCWPVPPATIHPGSEWEAMPVVPGGLPPGAVSAIIKLRQRVAALDGATADIQVRFGVRVALETPTAAHAPRGEGRGEVNVRLDRRKGITRASRTGRMELVRPQARNQVLRSALELERL